MASEMVERVAKRLWDHSFDRMPEPPWEETSHLQKEFHRMLACAAIKAMREPTDDMLRAATDATYTAGYILEADATWPIMIDAALKD